MDFQDKAPLQVGLVTGLGNSLTGAGMAGCPPVASNGLIMRVLQQHALLLQQQQRRLLPQPVFTPLRQCIEQQREDNHCRPAKKRAKVEGSGGTGRDPHHGAAPVKAVAKAGGLDNGLGLYFTHHDTRTLVLYNLRKTPPDCA